MAQLASLSDQILAAATFDPLSLAGLNAWFECGDKNTVYCHSVAALGAPCANDAICLGWQDRSGNGRHLTVAANGPQYKTPSGGDAGTPNGQGRIVFDGTNDELAGETGSEANWKNLHDGTGMTIYCVCKTPNEVNAIVLGTTNAETGIGFTLQNDDASTSEGRASIVMRDASGNVAFGQADATWNVCPAGEWHLWCGQFVPGIGLDLYIDDCFVLRAPLTGVPSTANPAMPLKIGHGYSASFCANHYGSIIHYRALHTAAQRRQVSLYLAVKHGTPIGNVACIGDSITNGNTSIPIPYPTALANRLGTLYRVSNFGVSGAVVNLTPGNDVYNDQWLGGAIGVRRRRYNYVACMVGINDLRTTADSAATIMERYDDILDSVLAEPGNKLIVCTVLPNKGDSGYDAARQLRLDAFNTLIRTYVDTHPNTYLVDAYRSLGNPDDQTAINPRYNLDNLHPNQTGTDALSALVADKLIQIGLAV